MKVKKYIFLLLLLISNKLTAQNLVPNPGFELVSTCQVTSLFDGMQVAIDNWFTQNYSGNSPDIFNSCFTEPLLQPPSTAFGYSNTHGGQGMAGVGCNASSNYREVISTAMQQVLIKDSAYCIRFFAKNSNWDNLDSYSQNLGIYISQDTINLSALNLLEAHVKPSQRLDGNDWIELSGYIVATGGEKFLNIGFFGPNDSYHPGLPPNDAIYYFIDDVSIEPCNKDSLLSIVCEFPNVFTVNDDHINETFLLKLNNIVSLEIEVFNRWGNLVKSYNGVNETWDGLDNNGNPLTEGVYFIKAMAETTFGETFQKLQYVHLVRP